MARNRNRVAVPQSRSSASLLQLGAEGSWAPEQGLELLKMFPEGEVVMNTKEPVESCADLEGVKFRVMTNPLLVESYKAFGATPTPRRARASA